MGVMKSLAQSKAKRKEPSQRCWWCGKKVPQGKDFCNSDCESNAEEKVYGRS